MGTTKENEMTGAEILAALKAGTMTQDEVVALMLRRSAKVEAERAAARRLFEKAPVGGWTDEDRVR